MSASTVVRCDVLIVGQAPGRGEGGPLEGAVGRRLAGLLGVESLDGVVDRVNLLDRWLGVASGGGDRFPAAEAKVAAAVLLASDRHPRLVAAGLAVARALGAMPIPLAISRVDGRPVLVLPNPSGRCRWWNDPTRVSAASVALRGFLAAP